MLEVMAAAEEPAMEAAALLWEACMLLMMGEGGIGGRGGVGREGRGVAVEVRGPADEMVEET